MTKEYRRVVCPHCMAPFHIELDVNTDIIITGTEIFKNDNHTYLEYDS